MRSIYKFAQQKKSRLYCTYHPKYYYNKKTGLFSEMEIW